MLYLLFFILAIGVATSSSLSNLVNFSSVSQDGQHQRQYNSCVDEESIHLQAKRSIFVCLRECTEINMMDTEKNITGGGSNVDFSDKWLQHLSWSKIALLSLMWFLSFTSFSLRQLAILLSFLLVVDYSHGISIILSFFLVALPYLLVVKYGLSNDDI